MSWLSQLFTGRKQPPLPIPPDYVPLNIEEAKHYRTLILERHSLVRCCELDQTSKHPDPSLLRIVLYGLNGLTWDEIGLGNTGRAILVGLAERDPRYQGALAAMRDGNRYGTHVPCQMIGFTINLYRFNSNIDLVPNIDQNLIVPVCDILATTEYADENTTCHTTGHSIAINGTPFRIYFYWRN